MCLSQCFTSDKVLKPTVSKESFLKPLDQEMVIITTPFILNDDIICFIAYPDVFCIKKNGYQKTNQLASTDGDEI